MLHKSVRQTFFINKKRLLLLVLENVGNFQRFKEIKQLSRNRRGLIFLHLHLHIYVPYDLLTKSVAIQSTLLLDIIQKL